MTVGIVAACDVDTSPKVLVAADRMLTRKRRSPIEYEHPNAKLKEVGVATENVHVMSVYSGGVSLAAEFAERLDMNLRNWEQENPVPSVRFVVRMAANAYTEFVKDRIRRKALDPLGLEMEDLSKQHQFKDDFFKSVWQDVETEREHIYTDLTLLFGGVDSQGSHVYAVEEGEYINLNETGYGATGSGYQPANSEFIRSKYEPSLSLEDAISVMTAAKMRSESAQGVGEQMDMAVVTDEGVRLLENSQITFLRSREDTIQDRQAEERDKVLGAEPFEWEEP